MKKGERVDKTPQGKNTNVLFYLQQFENEKYKMEESKSPATRTTDVIGENQFFSRRGGKGIHANNPYKQFMCFLDQKSPSFI